jgi:hypothetical protein
MAAGVTVSTLSLPGSGHSRALCATMAIARIGADAIHPHGPCWRDNDGTEKIVDFASDNVGSSFL